MCAKNHPDCLSRLATVHQRYRQTDRQTDFLWHRPDLSVGQKSMLQSAPKHVIFILKIQKCSGGEGTAPSSDLCPSGRGTPPPAPTYLGACGTSIFAPSALTHATPHTRKSGYRPAHDRPKVTCNMVNSHLHRLLLPYDAMHGMKYVIVRCLCLSVCLSVTCQYCVIPE